MRLYSCDFSQCNASKARKYVLANNLDHASAVFSKMYPDLVFLRSGSKIENHRANEQDRAVAQTLSDWGISYSGTVLGEVDRDGWRCDQHLVKFSLDQVVYSENKRTNVIKTVDYPFDYFTGVGLRIEQKDPTLFRGTTKKAVAPTAGSVLYGLLLDSEACDLNFNDWCELFGSSNDSIKALNTYRACLEIGEKLKKIFKQEQIATLRDLLQDY